MKSSRPRHLLFAGASARKLIAVGHADALARRDEILHFFEGRR